MGPQGYQSAAPRVALSRPTLPLLFTYPSNLLSPLQFQLASSSLPGLLSTATEPASVALRTPSVVSSITNPLNARTLLDVFLRCQKKTFAICTCNMCNFSLDQLGHDTCLLTSFPASIWSFRPSVFSQNALYIPSTYLASSGFQLVALSLFSLYDYASNSMLNDFDLPLVRSGA